jgi:NUMOD4 motif
MPKRTRVEGGEIEVDRKRARLQAGGTLMLTPVQNGIEIACQTDPIEEEWRVIEEYPHYKISSYGRIKSQKRDATYGLPDLTGYYKIGLRDAAHKPRMKTVHRLVAFAFLPGPNNIDDNDDQVDHKDNNISNNWAVNLQWLSPSANCKKSHCGTLLNFAQRRPVRQMTLNGVPTGREWPCAADAAAAYGYTRPAITMAINSKATSGGFRWEYVPADVLPGEIWKELEVNPVKKIQVSNKGRINNDGFIWYGSVQPNGVSISFGRKKVLVHRLVACAFISEYTESCDVLHVDKNNKNNDLSNLKVMVDRKDTVRRALSKAVDQLTKEGCFKANFDSVTEATIATGIDTSSIVQVCKGSAKIAGGFKWRYAVV